MAELTVTAEDRATLERWTTRRKTAHGLATRAEIVLRCGGGCSNSQVARELRLTNATVGKWRVYALLRSDLVSSLLRSGWFGGEWARWACVTPSGRVSSIDSF